MRVVDCKSVCREIDELDSGQQPSLAALEHTRACVKCRTFHDDRVKLREMVANVGTVTAPGDFDFRLRARLANEKGTPASTLFTRRPAFSFPSVVLASLALLIGAGFALQGFLVSTTDPNTAVSEIQPAKPTELVVEPKTQPESPVAVATKTSHLSNKSSVPKVRRTIDSKFRATARSNRLRTTTDSNAIQAAPSRRETLVRETETAAVFPIEASEPLRVSLDYASGISRTISLPSLSFGSQEAVTRGGSQMVKASAKGVW